METKKYTCSSCGEEHEEWPALAFSSPSNYEDLSQSDKDNIAELSNNFCTINYPDQADRFIRCVLNQKVIGHCEDLQYGLWVSLSEKSFQNYSENFNNQNHEITYFGWLSNDLPDYDFPESIPTNIVIKKGNDRPKIIPHQSFEHPFVYDYYHGISKQEAERRIKAMIEQISMKDAD